MKLYDITQELFSSQVYPGDVPPTYERPLMIKNGDACNLTVLNMCAHNGTHVDAPYHFYEDGKTIDQIELSKFVGNCTVVDLGQKQDFRQKQDFSERQDFSPKQDLNYLELILKKCEKRLLIKGDIDVTLDMAKLFNQYQIQLIGIEGQSVGTSDTVAQVHLELLGKEVVILEGLRLDKVPEGNYILSAAPLNLGGSDGSPCRAVVIEM